MMKYLIAERFKSIQGEGVFAGTPMAFIRFCGCSVGKRVCSACDTDFEQPVLWRGGGEFSRDELIQWSKPYEHICLTGGEPFDQDLYPIVAALQEEQMVHVESSGTKGFDAVGFKEMWPDGMSWLCISPKPGWSEEAINVADEVKVIMPGLGVLKQGVMQPTIRQLNTGTGSTTETLNWPTLEDALRWANQGKIVFLQPRNERMDVDMNNLRLCQDIIAEHPKLRLSVQLHKILRVQ